MGRGDEGCGGSRGEVDEEMDGRTRSANNELGYLERGEGALKDARHTDMKCGEGIVGVLFELLAGLQIMIGGAVGNYHKSVDKGVEDAEDPNGRRHKTIIELERDRNKLVSGRNIPDTSPHADHCTRVMVSLQETALFALGNDNSSINNFIELAQVEQPSIERQSLFPHSN